MEEGVEAGAAGPAVAADAPSPVAAHHGVGVVVVGQTPVGYVTPSHSSSPTPVVVGQAQLVGGRSAGESRTGRTDLVDVRLRRPGVRPDPGSRVVS